MLRGASGCLIAGYAIVRTGSVTVPRKSFIDLDQTKRDKRSAHLMICGFASR
jgi:hypothetical protein